MNEPSQSTGASAERPVTILHLEDDPLDRELVSAQLTAAGLQCQIIAAGTRREFESALERGDIDVIVSDYKMPSFDGLSALRWSRQCRPDIPFIFFSGTIGEERAVESLRSGATDYVLKQNLHDRLALVIERALREAAERAERRQAEEALRESQERLQLATQAFSLGLWEWDMESGKAFFSRECMAQLGYQENEIRPAFREWAGRLHPEDRAAALDRLRDFLKSRGEGYESEFRLRHRDGSYRWILARGKVIERSGSKPRRLLGCHLDITERKKLEQHMLRAQRMESIGTLAGGVAHDLNNVLAPILMSIEILRMQFPSPDAEKILSTLETSALRGSALVKQVLSFARGVEGERMVVNLAHILRDIQRIIRDTFPKRLEFELRCDRNLWSVTGDATQLHQILLNLCVNARDAMAGGGKLTIAVENCLLEEGHAELQPGVQPGPYVRLTVADTGEGIPLEVRDRIFEPFFTTKAPGKGTGLGLSTTLGIIKSHRGFIDFQSELGQGTTFRVYVPANADSPMPEGEDSSAKAPPRGHGELILVVDDEQSIRSIAQKTLEQFGYKVLLACHGAEAIAIYAEHREQIAVVLTDMAMPIMDGAALIVALKTLDPSVRIVASSGLDADPLVPRAISAGVEHFIAKPYAADSMLTTLAEVLRPME